MIDEKGLRANVGIIVTNDDKQVLWAQRARMPEAWQFPQGGIHEDESPEQAMYRELHEELGLSPEAVEIIAQTEDWLVYYLPKQLRRYDKVPLCTGQKQKWFLVKLTAEEAAINLSVTETPEFDRWHWVDYWYPSKNVVQFKRDVYRRALKQLEPFLQDSITREH
ncbi:MAG: RNA pyrophosphohydrolase [Coxiellaceae bacterium]|nr:RNA pyrophosphohydrolase [Coxiellaceae bacterium]